MKKLLTLCIIFFAFFNITSYVLDSDISDEEYQIYSIAIQESMKGFKLDKPFIIYGETMIERSTSIKNYLIKDITHEDLLDNYLKVNEKSTKLENKFKVSWKTLLINEHIDFPQKSEDHSSEIFYIYNKYVKEYKNRNGFIQLSRIGFSNNKEFAMLYINFYYGPLFGSGDYILLKKANNEWIIEKNSLEWIS